MRPLLALVLSLILSAAARAADFPRFEAQEIDPRVGNVCYAVTTADVDGDKRPDIVAVTEDAVVWFANPSWKKQVITQGQTARDNVCIAAHDVDGDGRIDFALGAGWKPTDTKTPGTLQWLGRDQDGAWRVHPIACDEPTVHRIAWGDVRGLGKKQLVVAPLQGRGTKGPNWGEGPGVRILVLDVPDDPTRRDWPATVVSDDLHTVHNLQVIDLGGDGRAEIVTASWEGVSTFAGSERDRGWTRHSVGPGNQATSPFKGSSEVKVGRLAGGTRYFATIEPWHGHQAVVYVEHPVGHGRPIPRVVIDEPVAWGHAVWCADLDGDEDDELIVGQRDPNKDPAAAVKGPGVRVYDHDPKRAVNGIPGFRRHVLDDGGMACEDLVAADLDGDGRPEIVAGGRATHNVKIYWNRGVAK